MSENAYFLTIAVPVVIVLIVFVARYAISVQQSKARLADSGLYRQVAERAAAAEAETASALQSIRATLDDMQTRLVSVETILKDVG